MIECIVLSKDDYEGILSHLKSARIECQSVTTKSWYHVGEADRHLAAIEDLLKKEVVVACSTQS
jgi:hypothetical protein